MTVTVLKIDPKTRTISKVKLNYLPITQSKRLSKIRSKLWLASAQCEKFKMLGEEFHGAWYLHGMDNVSVASSMVTWSEGYA
jgi:hypothetical protein